nr:aquaporin AQPAe.a-like isoform X1 [Leptinotarsa decemlineata]
MKLFQIFGHISGSHLNPAVTVAAFTLGHMPLIQVPIFFVGQILGSLAGFGLLKAVTPSHLLKFPNSTIGLCSASPNGNLSSFQVVLVEFILTFILAWACCGVWDSRNNGSKDSVPLRLGLTVTGLALAGGPYSGAHMNPARTFGPALFNGNWDFHLLYWLGPICGGFVAAMVYRLIFSREASHDASLEDQRSSGKT